MRYASLRPFHPQFVRGRAASFAAWLTGASFGLAALGGARAHAQEPLVRYTFDEQSDPVTNHGSLGNAAQGDISGGYSFVPSNAGSAFASTGSNSVEPGGSESIYDLAAGDFSVFARVRTVSPAGQARFLAGKRDNSGTGYTLWLEASGAARFEIHGSYSVSVQSALSIADGQWHEVLAVRHGAALKLYVDGLLEAQAGVGAIGSTDNNRALRVGKPSGGSGVTAGFVGDVDEFALWDRAVTPIEVGGGTDCNGNLIADAIELAAGAASDCDGDGLLDVCEGAVVVGDCNSNGLCDGDELARELAPDVDGNGSPDDCQTWAALPYGIRRALFFGDSLSDIGRIYALSNGLRPASPPNYAGRFSDGPVWCEYFAGYLGLGPADVVNLAVGGAASGDTNSLDVHYAGLDLPGLADQIDAYELAVQLGQAPALDASTLVALWIGANDFNALQQPNASVQFDGVIHAAIDNIETALRDLHLLGARKILVPNLPDLGATPVVRANQNPNLPAAARTATIGFNANLAALLARLEEELPVDFVLYDVFALFDDITARPADFGFSDVLHPCLDDFTGVACADGGTRLFWDELHPTTTAHRFVALEAQRSLVSGGAALPRVDCDGFACPRGIVELSQPANGAFTTESTVQVSGVVKSADRRRDALTLELNGVAASIASDGSFTATVALDPARIDQPIVATLRAGERVLDRGRVVVFRGAALDPHAVVSDAIVARLSQLGVGAAIDELNGQLLATGALNIRDHLLQNGWLASNFSGEFQYTVAPLDAGFACSSVDIELLNGRVFVRVNLHDLWVDYFVHGWFDTLPDPGIDCNGRVTASRFSVFTEFAVEPGAGAGTVNVRQLTPLGYDLLAFDHTGSCATYEDIIDALPWIDFSVEQKIRSAIEDKLAGVNQQHTLENELERVVSELKVAEPLGGALGVYIDGQIAGIDVDSTDVRIDFDVGIAPLAPVSARTFALPRQALPESTLNPVDGQETEFKLSIVLQTLNQLFLAKWPELSQTQALQTLDLGNGSQPITAGLFAALIPAMGELAPGTPMEIRARLTTPPMLLGESGDANTLSDLYVGNARIEFVPLAGPHANKAVLALAADLRGDVELDFDASRSELVATLRLSSSSLAATLVDDRLGIDESSFALLLDSIASQITGQLDGQSAALPTPGLAEVGVDITHFQVESGYLTCVVDFDSVYSRPDLVVEQLDAPGAIDIQNPFQVAGRIKNVGSAPAYGGVWLGATLSLDNTFMNGNDLPLGPQLFLNLGNGLSPGESMSFVLHLSGAPGAVLANQTLFVLVDVPFLPGGTGNVCERSEGNNFAGTPVLATLPDAYVVSITPASNMVGGVGPRPHVVRVGRNSVGVPVLHVPVRVTIGAPVVTWQDVWVDLAPGEVRDVTVWVLTPGSFGSAGQVNQFQIAACTNLQSDANWNNNCAVSTVGIAVPWWDLRYEIVGAPSSATHCNSTSWSVRVTNAGNVTSPNVCSITGIGLNSGAGNWNWNLGIRNFTTANIAPGGSWTFNVSNYGVPCGALQQTQYVKAEVHYSAGCYDNFGAGNYAQKSIAIH